MNKTILLFLLLIASAMVIWWMAFNALTLSTCNWWRYRISSGSYCCIQTAIPYLAQDTRYLKACLLEVSAILKLNILVL
jgi:hypothetical protein